MMVVFVVIVFLLLNVIEFMEKYNLVLGLKKLIV